MDQVSSVDRVIVCVAGVALAGLWAIVLLAGFLCPRPLSAARDARRSWVSANPAKAWAERLFIVSAAPWIALMVAIIASRAYENLSPWGYMAVGVALAAPGFIAPALSTPAACEAGTPLATRYWVRSQAWLAVLSFVGSYFWTHYFYSLLGATYTFKAHRLNGVPISMFLAAHGYFVLYHALTNAALRRWHTSAFAARLPGSGALRNAGTIGLVFALAWVTAFIEAFTIQGFPYYHIVDRARMYTVGSVVYGLYFVVSFPAHYAIDGGEPPPATVAPAAAAAAATTTESAGVMQRGRSRTRARASAALAASAGDKSVGGDKLAAGADGATASTPAAVMPWTLQATVEHALAACMTVTLMLDFWRIGYMAAAGGSTSGGGGELPWALGG